MKDQIAFSGASPLRPPQGEPWSRAATAEIRAGKPQRERHGRVPVGPGLPQLQGKPTSRPLSRAGRGRRVPERCSGTAAPDTARPRSCSAETPSVGSALREAGAAARPLRPRPGGTPHRHRVPPATVDAPARATPAGARALPSSVHRRGRGTCAGGGSLSARRRRPAPTRNAGRRHRASPPPHGAPCPARSPHPP